MLKLSSLACKCVFYKPKHNAMGELNFEGLKIQKYNTSTDRAQRVDEKNAVIYLIIVFTPKS